MIALFTVVMISYFFLLLFMMWGWKKVRRHSLNTSGELISISVLVPFRNEAIHIHHLIHSLANINYPLDQFEVIFINDHSEDNSEQVVRSLIHDKLNFTLINLDKATQGKKMAITYGVSMANHELIATTDADCIVPSEWLQKINDSFYNDKTKLVFGGVGLKTTTSFFSKVQALEFTSLIGSGAATMGFGIFTMCNGANLAYRKEAFNKVNGYEGNLNIASGDDEFLARKIETAYPESIKFMNNADAVVVSRPTTSAKGFIQQRLRWAGKWKYNASLMTKLLAFYILLVQMVFVGLMISAAMLTEYLWIPLSLVVVKLLLECSFLRSVGRFLKVKWIWGAFFVLQLIYPLYVIGIGIVSQLSTYEWKGRRLSHKM